MVAYPNPNSNSNPNSDPNQVSISRALEATELLAAFEPLGLDAEIDGEGRKWEVLRNEEPDPIPNPNPSPNPNPNPNPNQVLRNGELHIAETGEASVDLAAGLFAWRRLSPSPPT